MKKKTRKRLSWLLLAAMILCLAMAGWQAWGYYQVERTTQQAWQLAGIPEQTVPAAPAPSVSAPAATTGQATAQEEDPTAIAAAWSAPLAADAQFLLDIKLAPLKAENPDVVGWICIPGTRISYPLMQGEDNEYYLKRAWNGRRSSAGSIFLECKNNPNLLDFNTIVYGHHMANGSCFASIMSYKKEEFRQKHPCVYIVTEGDLRRYEIFSAYEAPIDSETYRIRIADDEKKQAALDYYIQSSLWEAELVPEQGSYILTLSTCTGTGKYDTRFVVQAALTGIWVRA